MVPERGERSPQVSAKRGDRPGIRDTPARLAIGRAAGRRRRTVVSGDRRCPGDSHRHRDVSAVPRPQAAAGAARQLPATGAETAREERMTHRDTWELLDEFLDGALGAEARWQVAAHLAECPICQTQVATQSRLRGVVRKRLMAVEPPPGLSMRLTAALTSEVPPPTPVFQSRRSAFPVRLAAFVGPALAALLLMITLAIPAARSEQDLTRELVAT